MAKIINRGEPVDGVWEEETWRALDRSVRQRALNAPGQNGGRPIVVRAARQVMRTYTTSFFMVSRFLPRPKRDCVELIYAAVRYPDEVVDSFPLAPADRLQRLEDWGAAYETALRCEDLKSSLEAETPCFLAGFADVVRDAGIPPEHYRSFLSAMRLDVEPRPFQTLDDLIDSYIYGSAIVVGYFLAHVYGAVSQNEFARALVASRDLGIGLQLTNFLRDVGEDERRGRMYLPQDRLRAEGIDRVDMDDPDCRVALGRVVRQLASVANDYYRRATANLDAFAPDSRIAIRACIDVYGQLNQRIEASDRGIDHRESVPLLEKLRALPPSGLWRIPKAWIFP